MSREEQRNFLPGAVPAKSMVTNVVSIFWTESDRKATLRRGTVQPETPGAVSCLKLRNDSRIASVEGAVWAMGPVLLPNGTLEPVGCFDLRVSKSSTEAAAKEPVSSPRIRAAFPSRPSSTCFVAEGFERKPTSILAAFSGAETLGYLATRLVESVGCPGARPIFGRQRKSNIALLQQKRRGRLGTVTGGDLQLVKEELQNLAWTTLKRPRTSFSAPLAKKAKLLSKEFIEDSLDDSDCIHENDGNDDHTDDGGDQDEPSIQGQPLGREPTAVPLSDTCARLHQAT